MNTYQSQQFWGSINGVIGFAGSVMALTFVMGLIRLVGGSNPGMKLLNPPVRDNYKLSGLELTKKGEDYLDKLCSLGMSKRTPEQALEWDVLVKVKFQPKPDIEGLRRVKVMISEFKYKGYIVYRETSVAELLNRIRNTELRKDLGIYSRIAHEEPVSDEEVNYLYGKLLSGLFNYWESLGELLKSSPVPHILTTKRSISLAKDAKTRGDKVIAIDAMISVHHDIGFMSEDTGYLMPDLYDLEEEDEDYDVAGRILNRLAGD